MHKMLAIAALAATATLAHAHADEGTPAQRAACMPDVIRLCRPGIADILDHARLIACIKANRNNLSAACRAALSHR